MIDPATLASLDRRKDEILTRIRSLEQGIITVNQPLISEVPLSDPVGLITPPKIFLDLEIGTVDVCK